METRSTKKRRLDIENQHSGKKAKIDVLPTTWAIVNAHNEVEIYRHGILKFTLRGHRLQSVDMIFYRDCDQIGIMNYRDVTLWNIHDGSYVDTFYVHWNHNTHVKLMSPVEDCAFCLPRCAITLQNGQLAYNNRSVVRIWQNKTIVHELNCYNESRNMIEAKNGRLVISYFDKKLRVWDVHTGQLVYTLRTPLLYRNGRRQRMPIGRFVNLSNGHVASYVWNMIYIWDVDHGQHVKQIKTPYCIANILPSVNGYVVCATTGRLGVYDQVFNLLYTMKNTDKTCPQHQWSLLHDGRVVSWHSWRCLYVTLWNVHTRSCQTIEGKALYEFVTPTDRRESAAILSGLFPILCFDLWNIVSFYL